MVKWVLMTKEHVHSAKQRRDNDGTTMGEAAVNCKR
jgi:hypothetical protein